MRPGDYDLIFLAMVSEVGLFGASVIYVAISRRRVGCLSKSKTRLWED